MKKIIALTLFSLTIACGDQNGLESKDLQNALLDEMPQSFSPARALSASACNAADRRDFLYPSNHNFTRVLSACAKDASGEGGKTTKCLKQTFPSLQDSCAQCYGNFVGCARSNCWHKCWLSPDSESCKQCGITNCQPGLETCTGIPAHLLPKNH